MRLLQGDWTRSIQKTKTWTLAFLIPTVSFQFICFILFLVSFIDGVCRTLNSYISILNVSFQGTCVTGVHTSVQGNPFLHGWQKSVAMKVHFIWFCPFFGLPVALNMLGALEIKDEMKYLVHIKLIKVILTPFDMYPRFSRTTLLRFTIC